jgi:hypothetical protein
MKFRTEAERYRPKGTGMGTCKDVSEMGGRLLRPPPLPWRMMRL